MLDVITPPKIDYAELLIPPKWDDIVPSIKNAPAAFNTGYQITGAKELSYNNFLYLWDLYQRCKFVNPTKMNLLEAHFSEIAMNWEKAITFGNEIFKQFVYEPQNILDSSICAFKYTEKTWFPQHTASVNPKGTLIIMNNLVKWLEQLENVDYTTFFYRPNNVWANALYSRWIKKMDENSYNLDSYDYMIKPIDVKTELGNPVKLNFSKSTASTTEIKKISLLLKEHLPPILYNADQFDENNIQLCNIDNIYNTAGLKRRRKIYVYKQEEEILACVYSDDSSIGLNFSLLYNACYVKFFKKELTYDHKKKILSNLTSKVLQDKYFKNGEKYIVFLSNEEEDSRLLEEINFTKTKQYLRLTVKNTAKNSESFCKILEKFYKRFKKC